MPTTDIAGSLSLINLGPLTTTFTAPGSCATNYHGGLYGVALGNETPIIVHRVGGCDEPFEDFDCRPEGDKSAEMWEDDENSEALPPRPFPYYSPGLHCPSSYETVGVAVANNSTVTVSGAFTLSTAAWPGYMESGLPRYNFGANIITSALGPEETAVICCPSGYTPDPFANRCYSMFAASELAGSEGCNMQIPSTASFGEVVSTTTETWEYGGVTTTQTYGVGGDRAVENIWDWPGNTYTFNNRGFPTLVGEVEDEPRMVESNYTGWTGIATVQMLYIIRNGTDGDGEESAAAVLPATNMWTAAGAVLAIWGVGAIAGAGLIAAFSGESHD